MKTTPVGTEVLGSGCVGDPVEVTVGRRDDAELGLPDDGATLGVVDARPTDGEADDGDSVGPVDGGLDGDSDGCADGDTDDDSSVGGGGVGARVVGP